MDCVKLNRSLELLQALLNEANKSPLVEEYEKEIGKERGSVVTHALVVPATLIAEKAMEMGCPNMREYTGWPDWQSVRMAGFDELHTAIRNSVTRLKDAIQYLANVENLASEWD